MTRVRRGVTKTARHKKVLSLAKGYRGASGRGYKRAKEALTHAWRHAFSHRRQRKGEFRGLWIIRIGAAARERGITYSQLIYGLKKADVQVDRKMLSDLAVRDAEGFDQIVEIAKSNIVSVSA